MTNVFISKQRLLAHFYVDGIDAIGFTSEFIPGLKKAPSKHEPLKNGDTVETNGNKEDEGCSTGVTFWDKLQASLKPNLPRDLQMTDGQSMAQMTVQQQALTHFWAFLRGLLIPSPTTSSSPNENTNETNVPNDTNQNETPIDDPDSWWSHWPDVHESQATNHPFEQDCI